MELLNLLISNVLNIAIFINMSLKLFHLKVRKKYLYLVCIIEISILFIFNAINISSLNMIIILITNFVLLYFCFYGQFVAKFFIVVVYICFGGIYEIFSFELLHFLFDLTYESINIGNQYFMYGTILSNLLLFITIKYFSKSMVSITDTIFPKKIIYLLSLPITSVLFMMSIKSFNDILYSNIAITLTFFGLFISNIFSFYAFFEIIKVFKENNDIKLQQSYHKINDLNYQILEMKYNNTRSFIHDIKKHINILKQFDQLGEYHEIHNYICELDSEIEKNSNSIQTSQKVLNLVINQKIDLINTNRIKLKLDIDDSDLSFLSTYEQNLIYSNLLDNAIESCVKLEDVRNIIFKIKTNQNYIVIKMMNSCSKISLRDNMLISSKSNIEEHGFGMNNIIKILDKHNGKLNYDYNEKINSFTTSIIFIKE
ncbi:MAG: GHKL domain-containing protein [Clostridia bacterium]